jgi:hypothetical protein
VAEIPRQAADVDQREDYEHGPAGGDKPPPTLANKAGRLRRLYQAKAQLEAEAAARQQRYIKRMAAITATAKAKGKPALRHIKPRPATRPPTGLGGSRTATAAGMKSKRATGTAAACRRLGGYQAGRASEPAESRRRQRRLRARTTRRGCLPIARRLACVRCFPTAEAPFQRGTAGAPEASADTYQATGLRGKTRRSSQRMASGSERAVGSGPVCTVERDRERIGRQGLVKGPVPRAREPELHPVDVEHLRSGHVRDDQLLAREEP